ncbi:MAG: formylglycine-generating enzyme family protein, partial [Gammaproteobacteria bacterium]|nr:formylglycine-generating enzyme family protein [Gammaproteobacteria bacterium]
DQKQVDVSAPYCLSRYPVTNAQYRAFIADEGYTERWRECWTDGGWEWREKKSVTEPRWRGGEFDLPNHPVVEVFWYEAVAFCEWLTHRLRARAELSVVQSVRLPTETEWEKAARGEDGREYPWGNENITPERANYNDTGLGATNTVGCFPRGVSPYGCEEMAGNVWEWCQNLYSSSGSGRVLRGGYWGDGAGGCRSAFRYGGGPGLRGSFIGF